MRAGVRLGVDVGKARVGLAACDPDGILATPVATLTRRGDRGDVAEVVALARERQAIEVVVGLPVNLSAQATESTLDARAWAQALHTALADVPVRLVDERLSTVTAHRSLSESGLDHRRHRSRVDQQAAVVILQVALDSERLTGKPAGELVGGRKPRRRRRPTQEEQR